MKFDDVKFSSKYIYDSFYNEDISDGMLHDNGNGNANKKTYL